MSRSSSGAPLGSSKAHLSYIGPTEFTLLHPSPLVTPTPFVSLHLWSIMRLFTSLVFLSASVIFFTAAQIPYAPHLFERSAVRNTQQRSVSEAESLNARSEAALRFKRSEYDSMKRSISLGEDEEEDQLVARGHHKSCHYDVSARGWPVDRALI